MYYIMNNTFKNTHGKLLGFYRRPSNSPVLLRFSSYAFGADSVDKYRGDIERVFGAAITLWSEEIDCREEADEVAITLAMRGSAKTGGCLTHYIYAFFSDYPTNPDNVKLMFDLIFIGNVDYLFSGSIGENIMLVRRIFENSPEYTDKLRVIN